MVIVQDVLCQWARNKTYYKKSVYGRLFLALLKLPHTQRPVKSKTEVDATDGVYLPVSVQRAYCVLTHALWVYYILA